MREFCRGSIVICGFNSCFSFTKNRHIQSEHEASGLMEEIMRNEYKNSSIRIVSGHHSPSKIVSVDQGDDSGV